MGLETTPIGGIWDLNENWPPGTDSRREADNHHRLIKDAIKKTFPNILGVVNASAADLNSTSQKSIASVTDYGAVGDGVTDDTAAIQAAIDGEAEGKAILFPIGDYLISASLVISKTIELRGEGISREETKITQSGALSIFSINPTINGKSVVISGMALDGGTTALDIIGPPVDGTKHLSSASSFKDLILTNQTGKAINIVASVIGTMWESINIGNGTYGIYANGVSILNATAWNNVRIAGTSVEAFHIEHGNDTSDQTSIGLYNLIIESNNGKGLVVNKSQVTLFNSHFEFNGIVTGGADIEMTGGSSIQSRVTLYGGYFGATPAAQSNVRVLFTSDRCDFHIERMRFLSGQLIDAGGFSASVSIAIVNNNLQPAVINYPGVNKFEISTLGFTASRQFISEYATGNPPLIVASTTPVSNLTAEPVTYDITGSQIVSQHVVTGLATLIAGTVTVTLTGSSVFTSGNDYVCVANDQTTNNAVRVEQISGTQFVLSGTGTNLIKFIAIGS